MSLPVLVMVVFAGISLVVFVVHLSGGSTIATIDDPQSARERFAVDFEEETVREIHIARDATTAFLLLESGELGIVHSVGDRFLTRMVQRSDIRNLAHTGDAAIVLNIDDLTWPGGRFAFEDKEAASAILRQLGAAPENKEEIA